MGSRFFPELTFSATTASTGGVAGEADSVDDSVERFDDNVDWRNSGSGFRSLSRIIIFCQILRLIPFVNVSMSLTDCNTTLSELLCAYNAASFPTSDNISVQ